MEKTWTASRAKRYQQYKPKTTPGASSAPVMMVLLPYRAPGEDDLRQVSAVKDEEEGQRWHGTLMVRQCMPLGPHGIIGNTTQQVFSLLNAQRHIRTNAMEILLYHRHHKSISTACWLMLQ